MEVKLETEKDRPRMGEDKRLGYAQARDPRPGKVLLRDLIIFHLLPSLACLGFCGWPFPSHSNSNSSLPSAEASRYLRPPRRTPVQPLLSPSAD